VRSGALLAVGPWDEDRGQRPTTPLASGLIPQQVLQGLGNGVQEGVDLGLGRPEAGLGEVHPVLSEIRMIAVADVCGEVADESGGEDREHRHELLAAQGVEVLRGRVGHSGGDSIGLLTGPPDLPLLGHFDESVRGEVVDVPVERRDGDVDKVRMKLMRGEVAVGEQCLDDAQTNWVQQCGRGHVRTVSVSILKSKGEGCGNG